MGLDDRLSEERTARSKAAAESAAKARERAQEAAWYQARPWASPSDPPMAAEAGEIADLVRQAARRLPHEVWRKGLVYRDRLGHERLALRTTSAWRSGSFESRVRYAGVNAGDGSSGDSYSRGRDPSWIIYILDDGRYAGKPGPIVAMEDRIVKIILGPRPR